MATQPMTIAAADTRKSALQSSLKSLTGFAPERKELQIERLSDPLDRVASSTTRDMAVQHMNRRTHTIHEIEAALAKIKAGDYGRCEQCGEAIAPRRLQIVPGRVFAFAAKPTRKPSLSEVERSATPPERALELSPSGPCHWVK